MWSLILQQASLGLSMSVAGFQESKQGTQNPWVSDWNQHIVTYGAFYWWTQVTWPAQTQEVGNRQKMLQHHTATAVNTGKGRTVTILAISLRHKSNEESGDFYTQRSCFIHVGFFSTILVFSAPGTFGHLTDVLERLIHFVCSLHRLWNLWLE